VAINKIRFYAAIALLLIAAGGTALTLIAMFCPNGLEVALVIIAGLPAIGICYPAYRLIAVGLWDGNTELSATVEDQATSAQWFVLQGLTCFAVVYGLWSFIAGIPLRPLKAIYVLETILLNSFVFNLIFILWIAACLLTVFRKPYGARFLLITCLWMLTLELPAFKNFLSYFHSGSVKSLVTLLVYSRWWLLNITLILALAVLSAIVTKGFSGKNNSLFNKICTLINFKGSMLSLGILLAVAGLGIQWFHASFTVMDLSLVRTFFFTTAAIAVMTGHLFSRDSVLIPAAIALPILLLAVEYFGDDVPYVVALRRPAGQVQIWIPLILLGIFYAFKKNLPLRLRMAVFFVPITFMLLSYFAPYQKMIIPALVYPDTFPSYLEPPEGAELLSLPHYYNNYQYDPPDFVAVYYEVDEPYPALRVFEYLAERFEDAGFSKLDYRLEFPETPSSPLGKWLVRNDISIEGPTEEDFVTWEGYWLREKDSMLLRVHLWCYDQTTQVTIEANHPVGWSSRSIKLRHQIQFYRQIRNETD